MLDERSLIDAALDGDQAALKRLYDIHVGMVFRFIHGMRVPEQEIEDCVQETFISAFRNLKKLREGVRFSTWLYSVAMNVSRSRVRNVRWADRLKDLFSRESWAQPSETPEKSAERSLGRELAGRILERIPEKKRAVLIMREMLEMTEDDIAEALQIPRGTVATRLHKARKDFERIARRGYGVGKDGL
jgi:RNA polymerase sigma-70 factor (ECF subfamily)